MKSIMSKILKNKGIKYLFMVCILIMAFFLISYTYAAFTSNSSNVAANITVKGMNYTIAINGTAGSVVTGTANTITKSNITITATNSLDSKYELTYVVCSDSSCTSTIATPSGFSVKYSSKTTDPITGTITTTGTKSIRIIINNTTATTYYIKLGINAGYSYNTLTLNNSISSEYNEDDLTILATINGVSSSTLPTTANYSSSITCQTDGGSSNATATTSWNGSKWVINVSGVDDSQTVCTAVYMVKATLIANGGTLSGSYAGTGESVTISSVDTGYSSTGVGVKCTSGTTASIAGTTVTINSLGSNPTCNIVLSKLFDYTGAVQTYSVPVAGTYKLQVWGAQGGTYSSTYVAGKGGYSQGQLGLNTTDSLYILVGGTGSYGNSAIATGGYNGGGSSGYYRGGSGGGATDIRFQANTINNRVIVAGGGGGAGYYSGYKGGVGGGLNGVASVGYNTTYNAKGATQLAGGAAGGYSGYTGTAGSFGTGGSANTTSTTYNRSGGGGGGWYGGGGGGYRSSGTYYYYGVSGGGGGSGWIYTATTNTAWSGTTEASSWALNSTYYLTESSAYTCNGAAACTNASGTTTGTFYSTTGSTETGHASNGYAIISLVS